MIVRLLKFLFGDWAPPNPSPDSGPSEMPVQPVTGMPRVLAAEQQLALSRPLVFEPALKQYNAWRAGEPQFADAAAEQVWYAARRDVLQHIATTLAVSALRDQLMLRGSMLLADWFPEVARRPGDLDWVVLPPSVTMESASGRQLLRECEQLLRGSTTSSLTIHDVDFVCDEIWTYEKTPGVRLIVPWKHADGFQGTVQLDFVFGEQVPSSPERLSLTDADGDVWLHVASVPQSLAWKLLWLTTDCYAQGKDLYDAVLLAEAAGVDVALTLATFAPEMPLTYREFNEREILGWDVDWDNFQKEYPHIGGDAVHWQQRLAAAVAPLCAWLKEFANDLPSDSPTAE
ncbi:MAG: nucleotidyl transferase AbiEii/AbiGii toxin family protein [Planctomycetaceae bacterium]|nr:nucleotidyl transferase AbiEii/AbiGii toxin family protein [Planctomycetaceae bacterium]